VSDPKSAVDQAELLEVDEILCRFDELLEQTPERALAFREQLPRAHADQPWWIEARGEALWRAQGAEAASDFLLEILAVAPDLVDARHLCAEALREAGHEEASRGQHLEVLRMDVELDALSGVPSPADEHAIAELAERVLEELPAELVSRLGHVAIVLEPRPSAELVQSGFDSRALGLFEGSTLIEHGELGVAEVPSRIVLFTACLIDAFGADQAELRDQVRITVLHELGHFLGLEEHNMERLGLD
jgi:predicted Zn-dependent protease with MMP-like domain